MVAGQQTRQVAPLLFGAAVPAHLIDAEIGVRAIGQSDRRRGAADLLHDDHVLDIAEAGAAILLLDGDAEQTEIAELLPQIGGKRILSVDLGGPRRDLGEREAPHRFAQRLRGRIGVQGQAGEICHRKSVIVCDP
jgi:hypothetical protein